MTSADSLMWVSLSGARGPTELCETTGANKFVQCDHEPINTCHEHELT